MLRRLLWMAVAVYTTGIWWLSSQGEYITAKVDAAGLSDLNAHFILFGGLGFLLRLAMHVTWPRKSGWKLTPFAGLATFGYGLIDEWHQSYVPGRGCDAEDLRGDLIGAVGGALLAAVCIGIFRRRSGE